MRIHTPANSLLLLGCAAALLSGCGGGGDAASGSGSGNGAGSGSSLNSSGNVQLLLSDGSSEDWATVGVKVQSIALVPQGDGSPVTVYAPTTATALNLAQLDQLDEVLGNVSVPVGNYTGAVLTIAANPGDVTLTASADPEVGFAAAAGTTIPAAQIQIQHTQGTAPNMTVPVRVSFATPLVVSATGSNALDLEIDLSHPAFVVAHVPVLGNGATVYAVNFDGPVRRRPVDTLAHRVLRHLYGTVAAVAADGSALTIGKVLPTLPATSPETASSLGVQLQVLADAGNGTLFRDMDAKTVATIKDFTSVSSGLAGRYVRVAARYQQNGTLVATRIWVSSSFNTVWLSPEGHVLHVDAAHGIVLVSNESGGSVPLMVNADTQFFFRTPANAQSDATPIATGTAFLAGGNFVRGFKVHASVVDPLATPLVAQSIDIETAAFDGRISGATDTAFTYNRRFATVADGYTRALTYIASTTANGTDANGNAISGFKFWDFAYPTLVTSGANAIPAFQSAVGGSVNFGGSVGAVGAWGASFATWGDAANPSGWSAPWSVLLPSPLPLGTVSTGVVNGTFTMSVPGGTQAATIAFGTAAGSATLAYQIDRTGGIVTVSPVDLASNAGLTAFTSQMQAGVPVRVSGVPNPDGTFKAYVITYYTGTTRPTL